MKLLTGITYLLLIAVLTGCGATMQVTREYQRSASDSFSYEFKYKDQVNVPQETLTILEQRMKAELLKRNMLAGPDKPSNKLIEIMFNEYNMRSDGARFGAGIFAGTDVIDTRIVVKGPDNETLGDFLVKSTNNTAWGTSSGLIEEHADKIVHYLTDGKK